MSCVSQPVQLSEVIGGYELERVLGQGGMSTVFLGRHRLLGRVAAVKVLSDGLTGNPQLTARCLREARIVSEVAHPNIVEVIDFVQTEEPRRVALIMEYIEGDALDGHLKAKGALSAIQA